VFDKIPQELREYRQWVVWRLEDRGGPKPTKVPYSPVNGLKAAVDNPATWGTFEQAVAASPNPSFTVFSPDMPVTQTGFNGIGFVLTRNDPFGFIDLDEAPDDNEAYERQIKIFREFNSYSELSPSGKGLHIIIKGELPHGRRRASIEVYSSERYMTMTGAIYYDAPIADRHDLFNMLFEQMGGPPKTYAYGEDQAEVLTDEQLIEQANGAVNGEKFARLFSGDWQTMYASQSEADFALVDIIAFYSQNRNQIARIFRRSMLGQRDKAQRDQYIAYMVEKSFDRQLPPVDIEGMRIAFQKLLADKSQPVLPYVLPGTVPDDRRQTPGTDAAAFLLNPPGDGEPSANNPASPYSQETSMDFPPGLVGDVAQFLYDSAPRPVAEIALAGAYGLIAGITGRAYNVSGTGLNQYVLVLAMTGAGKEAAASGISRLMTAVKASVPTAGDFIGPGELASAPGLLKWLSKHPAVFSIVGEFGLKLKEMSSVTANAHTQGLKRVLLDLYNKSGAGSILNPIAYSDREKNTDPLYSPAFTLLGESTPERFYEVLDEGMISDGLLPRFMVIEYLGKRVMFNEGHEQVRPPFALVERMASLAAHCLGLSHNGNVHSVPIHPKAKELFDRFNNYCDGEINQAGNEVVRQLWNRAHIKSLKLAALYAVGTDYINPLIIEPMAQRATDEIVRQTNRLIRKYHAGEFGELAGSEQNQIKEIAKVIAQYMSGTIDPFRAYGVVEAMFIDGVIAESTIQRKLVSLAAFRNDRIGATNAIKRAIKLLLEEDAIREIPKAQMQMKYGCGPRAYIVANPKRFTGV
jgi:hypothetical protein